MMTLFVRIPDNYQRFHITVIWPDGPQAGHHHHHHHRHHRHHHHPHHRHHHCHHEHCHRSLFKVWNAGNAWQEMAPVTRPIRDDDHHQDHRWKSSSTNSSYGIVSMV